MQKKYLEKGGGYGHISFSYMLCLKIHQKSNSCTIVMKSTSLDDGRYLYLLFSKIIRADSGGKEECTHAYFMTLSQNPDVR